MTDKRKQEIEEIKAVLQDQDVTSVQQALRALPNRSHWLVREAWADLRRERTDAATYFSSLTKKGQAAFDAGFFQPAKVTLPSPTLIQPVFPKAGRTIGIVSDIHAGSEHDYSALDVAIQVMQAAGVDELGINGDLNHCEAWSRHGRSREQYQRWIDERRHALPVAQLLDRSFPDIEKWMNLGNHDLWPVRFISENAPVMEDLFPLEMILGLDQTDIRLTPEGRKLIGDKILVKHGTKVSQDAGGSAKKEMLASGFMSTISGHVHRLAYSETRRGIHEILGQQPTFSVEGGCLCNLRPKYLPAEDTANWTQGFVILTVTESNLVGVELVPIHDGVALFRGLRFESRVQAGNEYVLRQAA